MVNLTSLEEMQKRLNELMELPKDKFPSVLKLVEDVENLYKENQQQKEEIQELKKKYEKSLELLIEYNLPCEIDNFNTKEENLEYCFKNCSVDERIYIKCWNRFIEQELEKE